MSLGIIAPEFPSKRKTNKGKFERDWLPMSLTHKSIQGGIDTKEEENQESHGTSGVPVYIYGVALFIGGRPCGDLLPCVLILSCGCGGGWCCSCPIRHYCCFDIRIHVPTAILPFQQCHEEPLFALPSVRFQRVGKHSYGEKEETATFDTHKRSSFVRDGHGHEKSALQSI